MKVIWYTVFMIIAAFTSIFLPFCIFYYETNEEKSFVSKKPLYSLNNVRVYSENANCTRAFHGNNGFHCYQHRILDIIWVFGRGTHFFGSARYSCPELLTTLY